MEATTSIAISELLGLSQSLATINLGYLSVSVTILVLLGGGTYFFSVKPFKNKIEKQEEELKHLKQKVEDDLKNAKQSISDDLKMFKSDYSQELDILSKQRDEKIKSDFELKLTTLDKDLFEKINITAREKDDSLKDAVLSEISNKILSLEKVLHTEIDGYKVENNKEVALLKNRINSGLRELSITVKELEAFKYDQQGKQGGIIKLIDSLGDDIQYREWAIKYKLEDIKDKLPDYTLSSELHIKLKNLLNSIKDKEISGERHDGVIDEIEKLITVESKPKL